MLKGHQAERAEICRIRDDQRLALLRVLSSRTFERCPRLKQFLQFIADALIQGRPDDIKEQTIGCAVFGRPAGYNHTEDNIVRVTARQLRARLDEYYRDEGKDDPWVIEIPRGTYVPVFHPRPAIALPEVAPASGTGPASPCRSWRAAPAALAVLCAALAIAVGVLGREVLLHRKDGASAQMGILRVLLPESGRRLNIVVADSSVQLYRALTRQDIPLNSFTNRQFLLPENLPAEIPYGSRVWNYLQYSRTTDFTGISALAHLLSRLPGDRLSVRHASQLSSRDFLNDNAILISSAAANPWVLLFEDKLNFRIEREPMGDQVIRNRSPKPSEPEVYRTRTSGAGSRVGYGRVALVPNLSGKGKVLLISGPSAFATEASAAFLSDVSNLPQLLAALGSRSVDGVSWFELVLEVGASERVPLQTRMVSARAGRDGLPPNR